MDSDEKKSLMKDSIHKLKIPTQKPRGQSDFIHKDELDLSDIG